MAIEIFDSTNTTKTQNHVLEANLYKHICRERLVIPQPTFYKPMIKVQIPLYKTGDVVSIRLCNYSEAQGRGIYIRQIPRGHGINITCMLFLIVYLTHMLCKSMQGKGVSSATV